MDRPDPPPLDARPPPLHGGEEPAAGAPKPPVVQGGPRYGRYVALLALVILVLITVNTVVTKPNGGAGIQPGAKMPPFAVPLATGTLVGDANVATGYGQGLAGRVPACSVRKADVLNICKLWEEGPVVLALFVEGGSCADVLSSMQALSAAYPQVRFAAVAIKGDRAAVREIVRNRGLTFPVGLDEDGALAALYKVASCPQVSFARRGGVVTSGALLSTPAPAELHARVRELAAEAKAAGGSP
jgi:hypothetical protein